MVSTAASISGNHYAPFLQQGNTQPSTPLQSAVNRSDTVEFGRNPLSRGQSLNVVLERSYERLRQVVAGARAELGLPENAPLDISPEATANRIADFALGAFDAYRRNHASLSEDEARSQFVEFIGRAIDQGIREARGILTALNALNPEVDANINTIAELVQQRLELFREGIA